MEKTQYMEQKLKTGNGYFYESSGKQNKNKIKGKNSNAITGNT